VQVDFSNARLAGANLTGARFVTVDWSGADLGGATWSDGRLCADGSLGRCD
jgi:uncharacterized protein YjbI with pentapeptide repeats